MTHFFQKSILLLIIITLFAGFLRFYKIDAIPVSLYWDEAASAYNAYSITITGKDEHGAPFPFLFRSFEDYKMSGNIYLTAFVIKVFGLNEFSARASSALFGMLTVFVTYFLIKELLSLQKKVLPGSLNIEHTAIITAFFLAISPWHIQFSRTGFEANVALFFIAAGAWLFLLSLKKQKYFLLSMIFLGFSFYVYRSVHVFLPLLLLSLLIVLRHEIASMKKTVIFGIIFLGIIILPLLPWMFSYGGLARIRQVNVISNSQEEVYKEALKIDTSSTALNTITHNRRVVYAKTILTNYLMHFSPQFLFLSGDANGRHGPRGMGLLYLWELPFFIVGVIALLKVDRKVRAIVLAWILLAPIPASVSVPSPHALRSLSILPMPQLLVTIGMLFTFANIPRNLKLGFSAAIVSIMFLFFVYYLHLYYNTTTVMTSADWADGYKQLVTYIAENEEKYEKVVISGYNWQPYIYFLFYTSFDPEEFQQNGSKKGFGKYKFGGTAWDKDQYSQELSSLDLVEFAGTRNALFALSPGEYAAQSQNVTKIDEIHDHTGNTVFIIATLKS